MLVPDWLLSLFAGSLAFATADVLCDVVISEAPEAEDKHAQELVEFKPLSTRSPGLSVTDSVADSVADGEDEADTERLTGTQDAAVSGLVTVAWLLLITASQLLSAPTAAASTAALSAAASSLGAPAAEAAASTAALTAAASSLGANLKWRPHTHWEFWLALLGGACAFSHDFFLLRAFEGAPSTVILPLIQVASVSVLCGSSVVALYRGLPWLSPTHAAAYALMFVGGLLPATGGELGRLLRPSFWRQRYVACAILSELTYGMHDLLASACSYDERGQHAQHSDAADQGASFEWFVWSRVGFVGTFGGLYLLVPSLRREFAGLFSGRIPPHIFATSVGSELLAVSGYYLMSRALGLFYQPAIVHAAEASLSQLLNLSLAYALLRACGIGRPSAVGSMRAKLLSFVLVTAGLLACTVEDAPPAAARSARNASATLRAFNASAAVAPDWQSAAGHFPPLLGGGQAVQAGLRGFDVYDRPWNSWRDRRRHRRGRKARRDYFMHRAEWSQ